QTGPVWPPTEARRRPRRGAPSRTVPPAPPLANSRPSALSATPQTPPLACNVANGRPLGSLGTSPAEGGTPEAWIPSVVPSPSRTSARDHSRSVPSALLLASSRPSALSATPLTLLVCPSNVASSRPLEVSHSRAV